MTRASRQPDRTAYAAALREWEAYQQWLSRLLIDPTAGRQEIAQVNALRLQAERKVLRLESWRDVR